MQYAFLVHWHKHRVVYGYFVCGYNIFLTFAYPLQKVGFFKIYGYNEQSLDFQSQELLLKV